MKGTMMPKKDAEKAERDGGKKMDPVSRGRMNGEGEENRKKCKSGGENVKA